MRRSALIVVLIFIVEGFAYAQAAFERHTEINQLKVVTYNHGLLNFRNPLRSVSVPFYKKRREAAPRIWSEFLAQNQPDAVMLQEIWYRGDYERLEKAFKLQGYSPVINYQQVSGYKTHFGIKGHGLQIFIRDESLELVSQEFRPFKNFNGETIRASFENLQLLFYRVSVNRGALIASVRLKGQIKPVPILLVTTHLTSTTDQQTVRDNQVKVLAEMMLELTELNDTIVVGADFNISPNFEGAVAEETASYELNAKQYSIFLDRSGMLDSYQSAERIEGYQFTQDRNYNVLARMGKSTKAEPEQRLDYVFLKGAKAKSYETVFTERLVELKRKTKFGDKIPMSDHFGIMVGIQIEADETRFIPPTERSRSANLSTSKECFIRH
jgi:endonuclease/exonuclease/phosphatase family metal-dependent hydrolase